MRGILYGIGLGPGDPRLLTVEALETLRGADVILVPSAAKTAASAARFIIESALDMERGNSPEVRDLVYLLDRNSSKRDAFWREQAAGIARELDDGGIIAYGTLGDVGLYSTFGYLHRAIAKLGDYRVERIPGISSIQLASARLGGDLALGGERLGVYPLPENIHNLAPIVSAHDTVVVMKIGQRLEELRSWLRERDLEASSAFARRVGFPDECVYSSLAELPAGEVGGLSVVIIKKI